MQNNNNNIDIEENHLTVIFLFLCKINVLNTTVCTKKNIVLLKPRSISNAAPILAHTVHMWNVRPMGH